MEHLIRGSMRPASGQGLGGRSRLCGSNWNTITKVAAILVIGHLLSVIIFSAQSTAVGGPMVLFPLAKIWQGSTKTKQVDLSPDTACPAHPRLRPDCHPALAARASFLKYQSGIQRVEHPSLLVPTGCLHSLSRLVLLWRKRLTARRCIFIS